ncbi:hypothetical protein PG997_006420 [Apiospora hydei]|uniref:Uncharacterized protein n=1 Tax=Apiospora hydei TaxID=1337664 RepID=A0ABR1WNN7_9PEZI
MHWLSVGWKRVMNTHWPLAPKQMAILTALENEEAFMRYKHCENNKVTRQWLGQIYGPQGLPQAWPTLQPQAQPMQTWAWAYNTNHAPPPPQPPTITPNPETVNEALTKNQSPNGNLSALVSNKTTNDGALEGTVPDPAPYTHKFSDGLTFPNLSARQQQFSGGLTFPPSSSKQLTAASKAKRRRTNAEASDDDSLGDSDDENRAEVRKRQKARPRRESSPTRGAEAEYEDSGHEETQCKETGYRGRGYGGSGYSESGYESPRGGETGTRKARRKRYKVRSCRLLS